MNLHTNRPRDERGAALILTVAFMVIIGLISAAVISRVTSGIQDRVALDQARDREYAADAAIETTVMQARGLSGTCPAPAATPFPLNNLKIHVDCSSVPIAIVGSDGIPKLQKNLSFAACLATGSGGGVPCTSSNTIINAQVNFQGTAPTVTTFVQAWSVNG